MKEPDTPNAFPLVSRSLTQSSDQTDFDVVAERPASSREKSFGRTHASSGKPCIFRYIGLSNRWVDLNSS